MTQRLDAKQFVPLTSDERAAIQQAAQDREIGIGLLSRALLLHAFDEFLDDPAMNRRIDEEKGATKKRISEGARTAVNARYATPTEGEER